MVSAKSVEDQLKRISYNRGWNRPETDELATILLPEEEIFECVNGWYEGGYALLCATNVRVILIDKKPFKFLTVEDVRFDTINQIDYSHRLFNASICISTGLKSLIFKSYNQPRLRKLISHVQHRMAEIKSMEKAESINQGGMVQDIDQQLKAYLLGQYQEHQAQKLQDSVVPAVTIDSDQKLEVQSTVNQTASIEDAAIDPSAYTTGVSSTDLYQDGVKEIFGKYQSEPAAIPTSSSTALDPNDPLQLSLSQNPHVFDTNPLKIAYSKLPMILRSKKRRAVTSTALTS